MVQVAQEEARAAKEALAKAEEELQRLQVPPAACPLAMFTTWEVHHAKRKVQEPHARLRHMLSHATCECSGLFATLHIWSPGLQDTDTDTATSMQA